MFRQDRTNPSTAISNWRGRHDTPKGWPSTAVSTWLNGGLFGAAPVVASGGTETEYAGFKSHKFTATGTFTVSDAGATGLVEFIVVAGGGGGTGTAGAGGAGGARVMTAQTVTAQGYAITIGGGGTTEADGTNSTCAINSISSTGGGSGAYVGRDANTGGCGGGGARWNNSGTPPYANRTTGAAGNAGGYSPVEGYAGGDGLQSTSNGGGGGGTAEAGTDATTECGVGGDGIANVYFDGSTDYYGGGGGGASNGGTTTGGEGGAGGGGHGKSYPTPSPTDETAGTANTGGGGGGGGTGASGGSGIVIIRYPV
jgi:hypothetical protein